jgi:hypothetical protein
MKLNLDYSQRLNLHALMGAQRASLDDLRMLWKLQDRIALSDQEKAAIRYRVEQTGGGQQVMWDVDVTKSLPLGEYEFNEQESARLLKMLKEWQPGYQIGADRGWLEPLLLQVEGEPDPNKAKVDGKAGLGQFTTRAAPPTQ